MGEKAHPYLVLLLSRFRRWVPFLRRGHDSLQLGGRNCCFPGGRHELTQSTERCAGAAEKPVCAGKRRRSRRRRGSIHGRAGLARCEITSGGGTRCSGREKAKESQWKRKRGGGGGDKRERERGREAARLFSLNV